MTLKYYKVKVCVRFRAHSVDSDTALFKQRVFAVEAQCH
jgi:hypothetical protein